MNGNEQTIFLFLKLYKDVIVKACMMYETDNHIDLMCTLKNFLHNHVVTPDN